MAPLHRAHRPDGVGPGGDFIVAAGRSSAVPGRLGRTGAAAGKAGAEGLSMNRGFGRKIWGRKIEPEIFLSLIFLPSASGSRSQGAAFGPWRLPMNRSWRGHSCPLCHWPNGRRRAAWGTRVSPSRRAGSRSQCAAFGPWCLSTNLHQIQGGHQIHFSSVGLLESGGKAVRCMVPRRGFLGRGP